MLTYRLLLLLLLLLLHEHAARMPAPGTVASSQLHESA